MLLILALRPATSAQTGPPTYYHDSIGYFDFTPVYQNHNSDYYITLHIYRLFDPTLGLYQCGPSEIELSMGRVQANNQDVAYYHRIILAGVILDTTLVFPLRPDSSLTSHIAIYTNARLSCSSSTQTSRSYELMPAGAGPFGFQASTDPLHAPIITSILTGGNGTGYSVPQINWSKNSDVPSDSIVYEIYRDNYPSPIGRVAGRTFSFVDNTLLNKGTYNYTVKAIAKHWNESALSAAHTVTMTNDLMNASDATANGKTVLIWRSVATYATNDIAVLRNGQQIAVINKSSTTYSDFDGLPGVRYYYSIAPLDSNFNSPFTYSDSGSSKPNGVLSGYVRSLQSTGITGARVTATGTVDGIVRTYTDTTDATGYYSIKYIYYDSIATYTVVATKNSDVITPASITRVIDVTNYNNTLPDFTDNTVFTVSGSVLFNGTVSACPVVGAKLYVNDVNTNTVTSTLGAYSFIAQNPGSYKVSFKFHDHIIDSATVNVTSTMTLPTLYDWKKDTLIVDLRGGCHNQIVSSATVTITAGSCDSKTANYNGQDPVIFVVPAQSYRVAITGVNANIANTLAPEDADLTVRDTFQVASVDTVLHIRAAYVDSISPTVVIHHPADTTYTVSYDTNTVIPPHSKHFIYHGPLKISLQHLPETCRPSLLLASPDDYLVTQNVRIPVDIYVKEVSYYLNDSTVCIQDTGTLRIYDDVSGAGLSYIQINNGKATYQLIPGEPNTPDNTTGSHRHKKEFNVSVAAGNRPAVIDAWMVIVGDRTTTPGYVSKAPPMPLMVLHDPPGSASYSTFEKDSSFSLNLSSFIDSTRNDGGYANVSLGKTFKTPFLSLPGLYFSTTFQGSDGTASSRSLGATINFTATTTISTSGDPAFVGKDADVFIGGTVNSKYASAFILSVDENTCLVTDTEGTIFGIDSVTSQFVFTTAHIRDVILPQLEQLQHVQPDTLWPFFKKQALMWKQILMKNDTAVMNSNYNNNITFSAGVGYDYIEQQDTSYENSYTYTSSKDYNFTIGAGTSDAELFDIDAGYNLQLHYDQGRTSDGVASNTATFGYHLEDDILGNHYSVSIGSDKNFGSPIFKLFAGASACPHEDGTQLRDNPAISISPAVLYNVPPAQAAPFVATLKNNSETNEARTYNVQLDPNSNLQGATVKIGGQDITQFPASFTIGTGTGSNVLAALSVQRGPFADDYNDLGIIISSSCDENISQTYPISVHFQSECSPVALVQPANNWLINGSGNLMDVVLGGYNINNPNLKEIGIEFRLANSTQQWTGSSAYHVAVNGNTPALTTFSFDASALPDGNYEIRAYARCLTSPPLPDLPALSYTYSTTLSGVIDRTSFSLFGTPEPANGLLNRGDNISVQFTGAIDCSQYYGHIVARLRRADNGAIILDTFACNGTGLIITTKTAALLDQLDGVEVIASVDRIYDASGNGISTPIEWSFVVNRAQVYWSPSNMNITNVVGTTASGLGTLLNKASTTQTYNVTYWPTWLTPSKTTDAISPNGLDSIRFTVNGPLNPGTYIDTIIATIGSLKAKLYVKLDVVKPSPNWTVNPASYQYSMNITSNYSLTSANTPLSTDKRDMIAVFKGEECRGVANISYDPATAKYVAFVTAYSNSSAGDTFTFRMWDAMPGTEYQAVEKLTFLDNGIIGQPLAPYVLHQGGVFQTLTFGTGWNWFSLNVKATDMSPKNVLARLHPVNGATVKTINEYCQYNSASGLWQGTLSAFGINKSYQIQLTRPDTIHLLGQPVTDTTVISVAQGWNWIGYPRQNISTATSYLANTNPTDGDLLKTQSQFTQYNSGSWSAGLNFMNPGQGYRLKSGNAFNFVVAPERSLPSWTADEHQYQQNQSITADLQFNGNTVTQSHFLVGAFANGVCVGVGQPLFIPSLNTYRIFLTVHGDTANVGSAITFKVYDTDNDVEYNATFDPISIVPDSAVAKVETPYVINVVWATGINAINVTEGYSLLQNVPNPFSTNTNIEYVIPATQEVNITLYDESGRRIAELVNGTQGAGRHQVSFDQEDLQSGVYFYQMKSGEFARTRRMLIIK